ncbi:MAG: DUF305 domain-containing protein [Mycobacteriales bacterium]
MNRNLLLPTAAVTAAVLLAACGGDKKTPAVAGSQTAAGTSASTSTGAASNDADVKFAQDMIVHHRGAIAMAKLAGTRAGNAEVKALAGKIEAAQGPEIAAMSGWLTNWGKEVPKDDTKGGMDHGGGASPMPGMMTDQEMAALEKASGAEFDKMFLEMMTKHHEGAIMMAKGEQANGQDTSAKDLAGKIIADQTAEIATMRGLLQSV